MRILHVTDHYLPRMGGIEMQVHDLAVRQRAAGHQVQVLTTTPAAATPGSAADPPWVHRVTVGIHPYALRTVLSAFAAESWLRPGGCDVVHAHISILSPLVARATAAASRCEIPVVVTVHSLWTGLGPLPRIADFFMRLHARPIVWSAVSDAAAVPLRGFLGPRRPVLVLPNAVDEDFWSTSNEVHDPKKLVVTSVMRLAPRKRPTHLLRTLRRVRQTVDPTIGVSAVIVGEGPERASLHRFLQRHGMESWVSLPGRLCRSEIRDIYRSADVYVAPALLESFGLAALEARCAGLPIVANAHGGIREFVTHDRSGLLTTTDAEMTRALVSILESPAMRARMSAYNRENPSPFTWDNTLARADHLYAAAVGTPVQRPGFSTHWLAGPFHGTLPS